MLGDSLDLVVRQAGVVLVQRELHPGHYSVGRAPGADLRLVHDHVSRKHGRIYFEGGQWFYEDLRKRRAEGPVAIDDDAKIELASGIDLMTGAGLGDRETLVGPPPRRRRWLRRGIQAVAVVLSLLMLGVGSFAVYEAERPMRPDELLEFARPKVVELEHVPDPQVVQSLLATTDLTEQDVQESIGFCSGFIVGPDVVLTAHHCIQRNHIDFRPEFFVKTHDGQRHRPTRVLGFDQSRDFLLLEVPGLAEYGQLDIATEFEVGETVYSLGNAEGRGIAIREGIAAAATLDSDFPEVEFLRFSAAVSGGNSGGPLMDEHGDVVGLVFARSWGEGYHLAAKGADLQSGIQRFVDDRSAKEVDQRLGDLHGFDEMRALEMLGVISWGEWEEQPELMRPLRDIEVPVEMPATLEELEASFLRQYVERLTASFDEIAHAASQDVAAQGWSGSGGDAERVVRPFSANRYGYFGWDASGLRLVDGRLSAAQIRILEPAPRSGPYASSSVAREVSSAQLDDDWTEGGIRYSHRSGDRVHLGRRFHFPQMLHAGFAGSDLSAEGAFTQLVGSEGALFDTRPLRWVRPGSHRTVTLSSLPPTASVQRELSDSRGRRWQAFSTSIFDVATLTTYCTSLPGGHGCLSHEENDNSSAVLQSLQEAQARYRLGQYVTAPMFFRTDDFESHLRNVPDGFSYPEELRVRRLDNHDLELAFSETGIRVAFSADDNPSLIRVRRMLLHDEGQTRWIPEGVDAVYGEGADATFCHVSLSQRTDPLLSLFERARAVAPGHELGELALSNVELTVRGSCEPIEVEDGQVQIRLFGGGPMRSSIDVSID